MEFLLPENLNPRVRLLPARNDQSQVYVMGASAPDYAEYQGMAPTWETVSFALLARQTQNIKVSLKPNFTLFALLASSSAEGGPGAIVDFATQVKDMGSGRSVTERGINGVNGYGVGNVGAFFLTNPYRFAPVPHSQNGQAYIVIRNLAIVPNNVQLVLYGMSDRWNDPQAVNR